ncbi:MAG TPA: M3 family oligoendopeptidase [Symbiobacteriaceae bacterium]|nr:M3 family oligoendopeptidase [Symbiobacteriaceae bacterium]
MLTGLRQTWNLENLFPGGSESPELAAFLNAFEQEVAAFHDQVRAAELPATEAESEAWISMVDAVQDFSRRLRQAGAFISCLNSQNVKDQKAKLLSGRLGQLSAAFLSATTLFDAKLLQIAQPIWEAMLQTERLQPIAFNLQERRRRAREKMEPPREALAGDLAVDGYHAWGHLYNTIVGRITIPFEGKALSAGQAFNQMSSSDRNVRKQIFEQWEKAWGEQSELIAAALNHLAGYRINLYKHRGWDSILGEPLDNNRMSRETLEVMWDVVERNKGPVLAYLQRKAKLLGLDGLAWYDVDAPLSSATTKVSYDEAANFILEHFGRFSPRMAEFAKMAFEKSWIEAEDRPGKRPGGFCTSFPLARESRIFMTFGGNMGNVSTLAHELGHAYHQSVMNDLPPMAQGYAMNVAETASTFAEMIVADAALKAAPSREERLALLADKVERSVAFWMNIHARFIFETGFYDLRRQGLVSAEKLSDLMLAAQKQAYHNALTQYHPLFWASKLHFYSTGQPFYNFPYTFGYLFSTGVYSRAMADGAAFEQKYVDLLRDTGRMQVEDLAGRHLGADLRRPEFWQGAVDLVLADIAAFLKETEE